MKVVWIIFLALVVYCLNEFRLIKKYIKAIEKSDKHIH